MGRTAKAPTTKARAAPVHPSFIDMIVVGSIIYTAHVHSLYAPTSTLRDVFQSRMRCSDIARRRRRREPCHSSAPPR